MFTRLAGTSCTSATSHSSPRRGSFKAEAVADSVIPVAILVTCHVHDRVRAGGVALGAQNRLVIGTRGELC